MRHQRFRIRSGSTYHSVQLHGWGCRGSILLSCYRFVYETSGDAINWHITPINLWPDDEEFLENKTTEEVKERVKDLDRQQANLEEILATVTESRLTEQFDNRAQLGIIPGFSDAAREEARKRYDKFASAGKDDE